jgi:hypothetical protein
MPKLKTSFSIAVLALFVLAASLPARAQFNIDYQRRYDQNAYLEAHDAYTTPDQHYIKWVTTNQDRSITDQLKAGVRSLDLRVWLVKQKRVACNPQAIIYNSNGDTIQTLSGPAGDVGDADKEIVFGHHIYPKDGAAGKYSQIIGDGLNSADCESPFFFESFESRLGKINNWMADNPTAVVTLNVGNEVPDRDAFRVRDALSSKIGLNRMFVIGNFYVNVGMRPPQGRAGGLRPNPEGWFFPMDGFPTLAMLLDIDRRVVYLPDGQTFDSTRFHTLGVDTRYGAKGMPKDCDGNHDNWAAKNDDGSSDIDNFTRPLFMMQHVNDIPGPTHDFTKCAQDIKWLKNKLGDITDRWHRLPQLVRVDHAAKETEIGGGSNDTFSGPKDFVAHLNDKWAEQPKVTPAFTLSADPSASGWNNSDVTVSGMWGTGDQIQAVVYSVFGAPSRFELFGRDFTSPIPSTVVDRKLETSPASYTVSKEGKSVVSFYAVGSLGNASDRGYIDVWIDKTRPQIGGALNSSPNAAGWYNADVTASFTYRDVRPGRAADEIPFSDIDADRSTPSVTLSTEGANQTINGTATDRAGNSTTLPLGGINLDKTAPAVTYSGNAGTYTVDQSVEINCNASDSLSGVLSHTCEDITGKAYVFQVGTHTYSASATDVADNVGNATTSFQVVVNAASLSNLTARFVANAGVANALAQKLRVAEQSASGGSPSAPSGSLSATGGSPSARSESPTGKAHHIDQYIKEVNKHTGRFITAEHAAILIRLARAL